MNSTASGWPMDEWKTVHRLPMFKDAYRRPSVLLFFISCSTFQYFSASSVNQVMAVCPLDTRFPSAQRAIHAASQVPSA
jgi:hypothetical protein